MKRVIEAHAYVTIIQGCGGWNSALMVWDHECACHIPECTGFTNTIGNGSREEAVAEARDWADSEGIPCYIDGKLENASNERGV